MRITISIALFLFSTSCRSIHVSDRHGKDFPLNIKNNIHLNGIYNSNLNDSLSSGMFSLWQRLSNKTIAVSNSGNAYVELRVMNETKLLATFLSDNKIIEEKTLNGKYKKGYFVLNTRSKADFNFGPLL